MCGRYTLMEKASKLENHFNATMDGFESFDPNYNVAPTHNMPVVGANKEGKRTIQSFRWGLLPL